MKGERYLIAFVNWFFITFFLFAPLYLSKLGVSGHTIGLLSSIYHILPVFLYGIAGMICDLLSPRTVLMIGFSFFATASLLLFLFEKLVFISIAYLLGSASVVLLNIGIDTVFYRTSAEEEEFSKYIGSGGIGMSAGYIIAGLLTGSGGFKVFFFVLFLLSVAGMIFSLKIEGVQQCSVNGFSFSFLKDKNFVLISLVMFLHSLHLGAETTSLALFLKKDVGFSPEFVGIFLGVSILFLAISGMVSGSIYRMGLSSKGIFVTGLILSGLGNIFMSISVNPFYVFLFRLIHVGGDAFIFVGSRLVASKYFHLENIGQMWGGVRTFVSLSAFLGAIIAGVLMEIYGGRAPFILTGFTSGFASLFIP